MSLVAAGCSVAGEGGVADDAPLDVYLSVPLTGAAAAKGRAVEDQASRALAAAGGKAGGHPIELKVLDATGGDGTVDPAAVGANARIASQDASTIAYLGELGPASETSLPITDLAQIPQIVLGPATPAARALGIGNLVTLPVGTRDPGTAAIELLLPAIERADAKGTSRTDVRDELRP